MIEDTRNLAVFLIKISNLATGDTMFEDRRQHGMGTFKWMAAHAIPWSIPSNFLALTCPTLPSSANKKAPEIRGLSLLLEIHR